MKDYIWEFTFSWKRWMFGIDWDYDDLIISFGPFTWERYFDRGDYQ